MIKKLNQKTKSMREKRRGGKQEGNLSNNVGRLKFCGVVGVFYLLILILTGKGEQNGQFRKSASWERVVATLVVKRRGEMRAAAS